MAVEPRNVTRKLTAVLAADIVGYSRLMGADEAGTLAQLTVLRKEVIKRKPKFSAKRFAKRRPFKDPAMTMRLVDALRKAGLPE